MGLQHFRGEKGDVTGFVFNMKDPVWGAKKELRQAFRLALDVPKIIEIQYANQAIIAESSVAPFEYGHDPNFRSRWSKRDLVKARELIAKAGYPDGKGLPPLTMLSTDDTTARNLDELLMRQLAEAGIVLKLDTMTWPEMMKRMHTGNFVMVGTAYTSDVPDVDGTLGKFYSKNIASGGNPFNYNNPKLDRLIEQIESMNNSPARLAKIREAIEILDDDLPFPTMTHRIGNQLIHSWVKNHVYLDDLQVANSIKFHRIKTIR
jgi:ABC-type transport system substrate-binding protein